jgi:hypothetical protein
MKRIATPNRAVDKFAVGKDGFRAAVAGVSSATEFSDVWFNGMQEAVIRVIEAAGIPLSDTDFDQFLTALRSSGVFQTAPQFDATTKVATMAALQRASGNFNNFVGVVPGEVLSAASAGQLRFFNAGGTSMLPPASTCPSGTTILYASGASGASVIRSGADTICIGGAIGLTSVGMGMNDYAAFVSNGTSWYVQSGSVMLPGSSLFASSLATSGYRKLPSGDIEQWGTVFANATPGTALAVSFPIVFPNACFGVYPTNSNGYSTGVVSTNSPTQSGFNLFSTVASNSTSWRAIGK